MQNRRIEIEFNGLLYNNVDSIRDDFDSSKMYGPHITIDCDKCSHLAIVDEVKIQKLLVDLANHIDMSIIGGPYTGSYEEELRSHLWGISGLLLIAESHIAIHTYPHSEKNYALLDVFSCKYFDILETLQFTVDRLEPEYVFLNIVPRGSRFKVLPETI